LRSRAGDVPCLTTGALTGVSVPEVGTPLTDCVVEFSFTVRFSRAAWIALMPHCRMDGADPMKR
jgi:hypothetical protein